MQWLSASSRKTRKECPDGTATCAIGQFGASTKLVTGTGYRVGARARSVAGVWSNVTWGPLTMIGKAEVVSDGALQLVDADINLEAAARRGGKLGPDDMASVARWVHTYCRGPASRLHACVPRPATGAARS